MCLRNPVHSGLLCGSVLFVVGTSFGLMLWVFAVFNLKEINATTATHCTVTSSQTQHAVMGSLVGTRVMLQVTYPGASNTSTMHAIAYSTTSGVYSLESQDAFQNEFAVGHTYPCYVFDSDPGLVTMSRGLAWYTPVILSIPFVLALAAVVYAVLGSRHYRAQRASEAYVAIDPLGEL